MRLSHFLSVSAAALVLAGGAVADEAPPAAAPDASAEALDWDRFDDPTYDPGAAPDPDAAAAPDSADAGPATSDDVASAEGPEASVPTPEASFAVSEAPTEAPTRVGGIVLGPEGVDDQGRNGRLHTVATGDTLWDLSAAYLGTPWVWPSVWIDNDDIANPHLILPGDKIWITANEMRVVTDAEAESFLVPREEMAEQVVAAPVDVPAAPVDVPPLAALEEPDDPSGLDAFPVAIPGQEPTAMATGRSVTVARRDAYGFVSADDLTGASSIVGSDAERTYLSGGDEVFLGVGEGDVEVGDQFTVFEVVEEVRDVETNRVLGHHVEVLGWVEVRELTGDTSIAEIRQSFSEIERGASVVPRPKLSRTVTLRATPDAIEGQVVFLPGSRTLAADGGYVYLNRGEFHGVEVGSELEVFESGEIRKERERRVAVRTPDTPIATLVVVTVEPESSVAFVLNSSREIAVGDAVRPAIGRRQVAVR